MISVLKKYVLGGRSGKRESGWLLLILWLLSAISVVTLGVFGHEMDKAYSLLEFTFIPVIMFLFGAYGLEWQSSQSKWKADEYVDFPAQ